MTTQKHSATQSSRLTTYQLALTALMTAVMCILGPISMSIPVSPVPISLGSLAVYLAVVILGTRLGTLSTIIYLLLGLVGLPVFSGYAGGVGKLLGPTGGYLIGYIFLALIGGFFADKFFGSGVRSRAMQFAGLIVGTAVLYLFGSIWLSYSANMTLTAALWAGSIPYIPGDAVKMALSILLGSTVRGRLVQAGLLSSPAQKSH